MFEKFRAPKETADSLGEKILKLQEEINALPPADDTADLNKDDKRRSKLQMEVAALEERRDQMIQSGISQ